MAQDQARRDRASPLSPDARVDRLFELILRVRTDAHGPQNGLLGFGGGDVQITPYVEILQLDSPQRGGAVERLLVVVRAFQSSSLTLKAEESAERLIIPEAGA